MAFGETTPTAVQGPREAGARSIWNPASLKELSLQETLMVLAEMAVATRLPGAIGMLWGVDPEMTAEKASPPVLNAATR